MSFVIQLSVYFDQPLEYLNELYFTVNYLMAEPRVTSVTRYCLRTVSQGNGFFSFKSKFLTEEDPRMTCALDMVGRQRRHRRRLVAGDRTDQTWYITWSHVTWLGISLSISDIRQTSVRIMRHDWCSIAIYVLNSQNSRHITACGGALYARLQQVYFAALAMT